MKYELLELYNKAVETKDKVVIVEFRQALDRIGPQIVIDLILENDELRAELEKEKAKCEAALESRAAWKSRALVFEDELAAEKREVSKLNKIIESAADQLNIDPDDDDLAKAIRDVYADRAQQSVLADRLTKELATERKQRIEAEGISANSEGAYNTLANIRDTLRSRGYEIGITGIPVDEGIIQLSQAFDSERKRTNKLIQWLDSFEYENDHVTIHNVRERLEEK